METTELKLENSSLIGNYSVSVNSWVNNIKKSYNRGDFDGHVLYENDTNNDVEIHIEHTAIDYIRNLNLTTIEKSQLPYFIQRIRNGQNYDDKIICTDNKTISVEKGDSIKVELDLVNLFSIKDDPELEHGNFNKVFENDRYGNLHNMINLSVYK